MLFVQQPSTSSFARPRLRNRKFLFRPFLRGSGDDDHRPLRVDPLGTSVEVTVPEQLAAAHGLYIWPSSPVLAWYLWLHKDSLVGLLLYLATRY